MTWLLVSKGQREEYIKGDISKLKTGDILVRKKV